MLRSEIKNTTIGKINGVFVYKVHNGEDPNLHQSLCLLTKHFNRKKAYPIVIFADLASQSAIDSLTAIVQPASMTVVVDDVSWRHLPRAIPAKVQSEIRSNCKPWGAAGWNASDAERVTCSTFDNVGLSYIYMEHWRYAKMPFEEALQGYEYFISIDADAFATEVGTACLPIS
jgi:hypothetical protein